MLFIRVKDNHPIILFQIFAFYLPFFTLSGKHLALILFSMIGQIHLEYFLLRGWPLCLRADSGVLVSMWRAEKSLVLFYGHPLAMKLDSVVIKLLSSRELEVFICSMMRDSLVKTDFLELLNRCGFFFF